MARQRKEKKAKDIKLRQPDRSAPTDKTLLQIAEERNLFNMADQQQLKNNKTKVAVGEQKEGRQMKAEGGEEEGDSDNVLPPSADRFMETILYAVCLAMLHFTLDYLVQHQYAMEIEMHKIITRAIQALSSPPSSTLSIRMLPTPPSSPASQRGFTTPYARPSSSSPAWHLVAT
ncbi:hypothetical protein M406DRAFT_331529 [Cryphonectria parasitica EP155]|uniref:Uncharacterized protein n=1 Tax=Cryphonectria parasitica (strain ATCC 38755 / EP155) TaxID=660469 RepID=A0A9P4Y294_CRYP1|nr:uncharacterized protein M406DRAFT_331529 [Cryphonectria parasitica EP155]KAF3765221.1 hypothetical protein M406DRAFT_331529 [Cryphonectria parasitica EP155]